MKIELHFSMFELGIISEVVVLIFKIYSAKNFFNFCYVNLM